MGQKENFERSESNEVILINTKEETQVVLSMTLTPKPLSPKMPLIVNELACVICDEVDTGNFIRCSNCRNTIYHLCIDKTCVEIVRNSGINQNCETTDKQKSLNLRQGQPEKYHQHQNVDKRYSY